ncbi:gltK [Wigglesworthia glossinidia endosymbiont of Glossina brevipalpis]|uniref:GltK protein n=1 Tax=Wigglesworthia glossinidia brevipalpis TaxID=36870 RepID=Q8D313_WIGBR|nr:gltK [Wigglesworthia glossinidia endosymbiont of Glossina brevipalpis]
MNFEWSVISENLSYFIFGNISNGNLEGLLLTLFIAFFSGIISLLLGVIFTMISWCFPNFFYKILFFLSEIIRGIPLIFIIFWIYFTFPLIFSSYISQELTIIIALVWFNSLAIMHSTLSSIKSLPKGQTEAGLSEGLNYFQVFWIILLPQSIKNAIPSWSVLIISLVKDTSLAFILNVPELTTIGSQLNNLFQIYSLEIFVFVGFLYYLSCSLFSFFVKLFFSKK